MQKIPSDWNAVPLKECTEIVSGSTPSREIASYWGGTIPWATPKDLSNLEGPILEHTPEHITEAGFKSCSTQLIPEGAVLFSSRAPIGLVAIAGKPLCTNQGFKSFIPRPNVDGKYLFYCLKEMVPQIQALGNGATFKEVSKSVIGEVRIPLPRRLDQQRHIAAILDKADSIRRRRHKAVHHCNRVAESIFFEFFGNPHGNPRNWESEQLSKLVPSEDKINYGVVQPGIDYPGGIPIVRVGNLRDFRVETSNLKLIDPVIEATHRRSRLRGDEILVACVGSIGLVALADERVNGFNTVRAVARIRCGPRINRYYLAYYLATEAIQSYFRQETRTVSQPTLNITQIEQTAILLPPLNLQERFADAVMTLDRMRGRLTQASLDTEKLFVSLVDQAFRGEL